LFTSHFGPVLSSTGVNKYIVQYLLTPGSSDKVMSCRVRPSSLPPTRRSSRKAFLFRLPPGVYDRKLSMPHCQSTSSMLVYTYQFGKPSFAHHCPPSRRARPVAFQLLWPPPHSHLPSPGVGNLAPGVSHPEQKVKLTFLISSRGIARPFAVRRCRCACAGRGLLP
jgi:hypothetical protein